MEQSASTTPVANGAAGVVHVQTISVPMSAADLKSRIFASSNPKAQFKRQIINFFGENIELRQASLAEMTEMMRKTTEGDDDDKSAAIWVLTNYACIPGTNDKIFDIADIDQLKALPFNEDFRKLIDAYNEISGISVEKEVKN